MKNISIVFVLFLICNVYCTGQNLEQDSIPMSGAENIEIHHTYHSNSSIETVNVDKIQSHGNLQILSLLQNQSSSLLINNNSGSPGASISAILRGRKSFFNTSSPLIILDGLPIDNSEWNNVNGGTDQSNRLIEINPQDIESVDIIKGSVGAVLYGIRGANGVLVLKSKMGKNSPPKIQVSSEITISKVGKLPTRQSTYSQGYSGIYRGPSGSNGYSWGPEISSLEFDGDSEYPYDKNGFLVPEGQGNGAPASAYDPYVFFQNAISRNLNASISGGNKSINYFVSGGHNKTNGVIPKSDFSRNSFLGRISADLNKKISIEATGRFSTSNSNKILKGANVNGVMLGLLRNSPTFDITNGLEPSDAENDKSAYTLVNGSQRSFRPGVYDNPYWSINNNPNAYSINRVLGSTLVHYQITDNISLEASGGIDTYTENRNGGIERSDIDLNVESGSAYQRSRDFQSSNLDLSANIEKELFSNFKTKLQLGVNYFNTKIKDSAIEGYGLKSTGTIEIGNTSNTTTYLNSISTRNFGILSTFDVNAYEAINLTISGRQDYSSLLGSNQKGFLSYGIHTSINILRLLNSDEQVINGRQFTVFAGIGRSGMAPPSFASRSYYVPAIISGDIFLIPETIENTLEKSEIAANPDLKAEKTDALEIGFNASFLSNMIGVNLTYYNEKSTDVILLYEVPRSSGYSTIYDNIATIRNKGLELSVNVNPIKTNKFSWVLTGHFNAYKNTIEDLGILSKNSYPLNGFSSISSSFIEGQDYGVFFGNGFLKNESGALIIDDEGYPIIDQEKRVLGNPNPRFTLGLENQFKIGRNVSINVLIDMKKGGEMYCGTCEVMDYFGVSQLSADERNDTRVIEGVNENGSVNSVSINMADPNQTVSSYYRVRYGFSGLLEENLFDASWVRIRRLNLSYDFSSKFEKVRFIDALKLALYADNLWLSTKYPGIDPETNLTGNSNGFGIDYFNNPSTRSVGVSLILTL